MERGVQVARTANMTWQYGGATNIFSIFCSLLGFSSCRRITLSNRTNNEHLIINLAAVTADDFQMPPHPSRTVIGNPVATVLTQTTDTK
ncbi:MAG TPA: hypothetical protein VIJ75_16055 [Hanamia sp.]